MVRVTAGTLPSAFVVASRLTRFIQSFASQNPIRTQKWK